MAGHVLPGQDDNILLTLAFASKMRLEKIGPVIDTFPPLRTGG